MCTVPSVLMGPSLTSFIASNFALLQPTLVPIQGGTFLMGAGTDYGAHQATVSSFQMGRTPVTNDEYARHLASLGNRRYALIGEIPATKTLGVLDLGSSEDNLRSAVETTLFKVTEIMVAGGFGALSDVVKNYLDSLKIVHIGDHNPQVGFEAPRQPVVNVNWYEAFVYAFLHGGMLPTEWQWEYAARAVQGSRELREYATPSGQLTHEEVHFDAQSTVDVDDPRYPTLENGLRHMTGNVWEWMQNLYGDDRYGDYPQGEVVDPTGPLEWEFRSLRGGSWEHDIPENFLAATRSRDVPDISDDALGFRVVAASQDFNK